MTDIKNPVFTITTREGNVTVMLKGNLCEKALLQQQIDPNACALFRWFDKYTERDARTSDMKSVLEVQESICNFCQQTSRVSKSR